MNVYDFDNTVYEGESALQFFFFYIKRDPCLLKYIPKVLHAFMKYKAGKVSVEQALADYAPFVEDYFKKIPDLKADAVVFWNEHEKNIKPFYKELQKDDDVFVTASPINTMAEICKRLGVKHCVGSIIDEETGRITRLCMRANKVPAFKEAFPNADIDNFYTDSPKNDAPLIELAEHAFIVKGNKVTQIK